jgi:hypothetical protein
MSPILLTIPDAPGQLAGWLERQLVGLDLRRLVAELEAVHGPAPQVPLRQTLGPHLARIVQGGLGGLPPEVMRRLLRQPLLLLELHEFVLVEGGHYWESVLAGSPRLEERVERGRRHVETLAHGRRTLAPGKADRRAWLGVVLALAAGLLLLVGVWWQWRPSPASGWGWDRPGALAANRTREEYLTGLADGANEWFNKRPETPQALAKRLNEFRAGCSTLILAEHGPLTPDDRTWLRGKCRAWAKKLDGHLADLEAGKDVEAVRGEADATVNQLIKALRTQAGQVT